VCNTRDNISECRNGHFKWKEWRPSAATLGYEHWDCRRFKCVLSMYVVALSRWAEVDTWSLIHSGCYSDWDKGLWHSQTPFLGERAPATHRVGGWVSLRSCLDGPEIRKYFFSPGSETQIVQPVPYLLQGLRCSSCMLTLYKYKI